MLDSTDATLLRMFRRHLERDAIVTLNGVNRRVGKDLAAIPLPALAAESDSSVEPQLDWLSASDGTQLACRIWRGRVDHPVIVYLHGIEGHSQWFEHTASVLNRRGITVYAPDRRGAGMNARDRGHLARYSDVLADIELLLRQVAAGHEGQSIFLIGNCWGAKAATILAADNYKSDHPPIKLRGLVLTSPALHTKVDFDLKTKLMIGYCSFKGDRHALKHLPIPIDPSMFTNNPSYLDFIEKDPLRLTEATTKFYFEQFLLTLHARRTASHLRLPLLVVQSGSDQIVDIAALENWYGKIKSSDKTMRIFPDAAHSIDFDAVWFKEYSHLLIDWLLARQGAVTP